MNWLGVNWLAVICAGAAYWVLGFVWYTLLFGKVWAAELGRHRGERAAPSGSEMGAKMIGTLICNLIAAAAMAYIFHGIAVMNTTHALRLAAAVGIGFAGTAITMASIWESKPTKVWCIDAGFNFVGCILMALILVSWR
jgi:hypothetical protein